MTAHDVGKAKNTARSEVMVETIVFGLIFLLSGWGSISQADPAPGEFWPRMNEALTEVLLSDSNPTEFADIMRLGEVLDLELIPGKAIRTFDHERARLHVVLDAEGETETKFSTYVLQFSGDKDVMLPGFHGSLSNCSEISSSDCTRIELMRRSDFTLGVTACLCEQGARSGVWQGQDAVFLPCWLGRGATYLNFVLVYADQSGQISNLLTAKPGRSTTSICLASDAAHNFPEFFTSGFVGVPLPPPPGVDVNALPVGLSASIRGLELLLNDARTIDEYFSK